MDVLSVLRSAISRQKSSNNDDVFWATASGARSDLATATHLVIAGQAYDRALPTAYKEASSGVQYPLDALYFAHVKRDAQHSEYFQECLKSRLKPVTLIQKRDLFAYLSGSTDTSPYIDLGMCAGGEVTIV
jgi:hypothetical protein